MSTLLWLVVAAMWALEIDAEGRWVENAAIPLAGAEATDAQGVDIDPAGSVPLR